MLNTSRWLVVGAAALAGSLSLGTLVSLTSPRPLSAVASPEQSTAFPDTAGHWAQPFIQPLAAEGILAGYEDNTFRPEATMARDEFAAVVRQAFNQERERTIASGSVYQDVPADHWAVNAIEEAYEMGFMTADPQGFFRPNDAVTRTDALASLARNLDLLAEENAPTAAQENAPTAAATPAPEQPVASQPAPATRQAQRMGFMPMAMTSLMQPFVTPPQRRRTAANRGAQTAAAPTNQAQTSAAPTTAATNTQAAPSPDPATIVSNQYVDANEIPDYAVNSIAGATQHGIVVNHPDPQVLEPNRPATRAEVAAFVHQALVQQGRLAPIAEGESRNYIVNPEGAAQ